MFRGLFKLWLFMTVLFVVHSYNLHQNNPDLMPISWNEAIASVMAGWIIFGTAALTVLAPFTWPILGILFFARGKKTLDHVDEHFEHFEHGFNHKMHHHKYHSKHRKHRR